jgi:hypothetical protein
VTFAPQVAVAAPLNPHDERVYGRLRQAAEPSQSSPHHRRVLVRLRVALAAGEVDISFGGDKGGSIRLPAAYCGVVGLKPTFGLVSHFAVGFAGEPSVDHVGPMARTVADVTAALQAVAGYDDNDLRQRRCIPESIDRLSDHPYAPSVFGSQVQAGTVPPRSSKCSSYPLRASELHVQARALARQPRPSAN